MKASMYLKPSTNNSDLQIGVRGLVLLLSILGPGQGRDLANIYNSDD